ncbi:MAG: FlgD immunoglobulin-like domain containing protein, partial [Candidatus Eiseniibacteriota bacterium]
DGGQTFEPAQLASGGLSAVLDNATWHPWTGTQVVGSEVSGNLYTGNVVISLEDAGWQPELVPPADQGSSAPSGGIHRCVTDRGGDRQTGAHSVLYTHMAGIEADSAEVWFVATPEAGAIDDAGTPRLDIVSPVVRAAPNPFATRTWIEIDGLAARAAPALTVHDVAGRIVRTLAARPGRHRYAWDGKDAAGRDVASGIYYVRIEGLPRDARTGDAPGRLVVVR